VAFYNTIAGLWEYTMIVKV